MFELLQFQLFPCPIQRSVWILSSLVLGLAQITRTHSLPCRPAILMATLTASGISKGAKGARDQTTLTVKKKSEGRREAGKRKGKCGVTPEANVSCFVPLVWRGHGREGATVYRHGIPNVLFLFGFLSGGRDCHKLWFSFPYIPRVVAFQPTPPCHLFGRVPAKNL